MSHANLVTQLPRNKEEMAIECTEIVDSEADVCGSVFFSARDEKKESLKSYTVLKFRSTERTFETTTTYSPPPGKVSDCSHSAG